MPAALKAAAASPRKLAWARVQLRVVTVACTLGVADPLSELDDS